MNCNKKGAEDYFDAQPKFDKLFAVKSKLGLKVQRQEANEMTMNVQAAIAFIDTKSDIPAGEPSSRKDKSIEL